MEDRAKFPYREQSRELQAGYKHSRNLEQQSNIHDYDVHALQQDGSINDCLNDGLHIKCFYRQDKNHRYAKRMILHLSLLRDDCRHVGQSILMNRARDGGTSRLRKL